MDANQPIDGERVKSTRRRALEPVLGAVAAFLLALAAMWAVRALAALVGDVAVIAVSARLIGDVVIAGLVGGVAWQLIVERRSVLERTQASLTLAEVASEQHGALRRADRATAVRRRVRACIDDRSLEMVFQPIVATRGGAVIGIEAFARFADGRAPTAWFTDAAAVGLGTELEILALHLALEGAASLPPEVYVAVNVSPGTVSSPLLAAAISSTRSPLVLELTEQVRVDSYDDLLAALVPLRSRGVRLAASDTGSGYAGLSHLVRLAPECVKLDRRLTTGIDRDPAKQALASSVADFAGRIGSFVVAQGVETEDELAALTRCGIRFVQGHFLARPGPLPARLPRFPHLKPGRALIVDDDPMIRSILHLALEKGGFDVVGEAGDGVAAIAATRASHPDVIVLDLEMPIMTGQEAVPALRALAPEAVIVVLSAGHVAPELAPLVDGQLDKRIAASEIADLIGRILSDVRSVAPARRTVDA